MAQPNQIGEEHQTNNLAQLECQEKLDINNDEHMQEEPKQHEQQQEQQQQQEQPNEVVKIDHQKQYSQDTVKIYAPVLTQGVNISETRDKEPMAIIPVPDSQATIGLPISTINGLLGSHVRKSLKAEMDARELLIWNNGIGVLEGCDLRFRINKHGCLELLDSDDEELGDFNNTSNRAAPLLKYHPSNGTTLKMDSATADISSQVKQISPGSSLLRDGPNMRRPTKINQTAIMRKLEIHQNGILLEKLIPKHRIETLKKNVDLWTPREVREFVDSIPGCSGFGQLFELQEICGKSLLYLDQKDLLDVINVKLGPAVKIYHAISLLK